MARAILVALTCEPSNVFCLLVPSLAPCSPPLQFWLHCVRFAGLQLCADPVQHHEPQQQQQQQQQLAHFMPCIILIGMRGSGKSSIGHALARGALATFYDCDHCIKVH